MFIKSVKVKNFRGFTNGDFSLEQCPFVLLTAPNGTGKTSIIDAIEWCLTGNIGRLKNAYDMRSSNPEERKTNIKGILKNKNAGPDDEVFVEVTIVDGDSNHTISRRQKKDELETTGKAVTILIDGKKQKKGDWIDQHIDKNFYNYHFCDVQKSIMIQGEKRADLSEKFKQFISDYTTEETVKTNLEFFIRDIDLKIGETEAKQEKKQEIIEDINEKLKENSSAPEHLSYPDTKLFEGEIVELSGKGTKHLGKQQETLYECGYLRTIEILSLLINDQKHNDQIQLIDDLKTAIETKKEDIDLAIKYGLDEDGDEVISTLTKEIEDNKKLRLTEKNILEKGAILTSFGKDSFTETFFKDEKEKIEKLDKKITTLTEDIQSLTEGNRIVQAMALLLEKKEDILSYRTELIERESEVRCPVCGSLEFKNCDHENVLKEASCYMTKNSEKGKEKTEEKADKENEKKSNLKDLVEKGKEVLKKKIKEDEEKLEELINVQNETKVFFETRKKLFDSLNEKIEIASLNDVFYLKNKQIEVNACLLSKEQISEKKEEIKEILSVLNYSLEDMENLVALKSKLNAILKKKPKLLSFSKELFVEKVNALSYLLKNKKFMELNQKLTEEKQKLSDLDSEKAQMEKSKEWAERHIKEIDTLVAELRQQEYDNLGPNLFRFYKKLTRINTVKMIRIVPEGKEFSVVDEEGKHIVNILSNGQISVFMLALFFAGILDRDASEKLKIYFIDDLTSCMDDVNMLAFLDLLKYMLKDSNGPMKQLFFATCDNRIEKLLRYKMEGSGIPYFPMTEEFFLKAKG